MEEKRKSDLATIDTIIQSLTLLKTAVEDESHLIGATDAAQRIFANALQNGGDMPDVAAISRRFADVLPDVAAISFMDADGNFIEESNLSRTRLSWCFGPFLKRQLTPDASLWTDPLTIQDEETGMLYRIMACITPINNDLSEHVGYVVAYFDTEVIRAFLPSDTDTEFYVADVNNFIVSSVEPIPYYISVYDFSRIPYTYILEDTSNLTSTSRVQGSVITTKKFDAMHVQVLMISPFSSIREALSNVYSQLIILFLFGILFGLIASIIVARTLTNPLLRLNEVVQRVANGDLSVRYTGTSRDEIAQLGNTFNQMLDTIEKLMGEAIALQKRKRRLQFQLLQSQVKPHFLYNTMEMISSLILNNMTKEAHVAVQAIARFYRVSLNDGSDMVTVEQEEILTESYLSLQHLRYIEFMDYEISIDKRLYPYAIPKLILQPLVENAIYHGLKEKHTKGLLRVHGFLQDGQAVFEIWDNGQGIGEEQVETLNKALASAKDGENSKHGGLESVIGRLHLYCGESASLSIESKLGQYTKVLLSFPVIDFKPKLSEKVIS